MRIQGEGSPSLESVFAPVLCDPRSGSLMSNSTAPVVGLRTPRKRVGGEGGGAPPPDSGGEVGPHFDLAVAS